MQPGTALRRIAQLTCTDDRCDRVLDAALADLQHEWRASNDWRVLARGYAVFWRSWGACLVQDATGPESRSFATAALGAFVLALAVCGLTEFGLMHVSFTIRRLILSAPSRVVAAAMFDTATLRYGVPLAVGLAVCVATSRGTRVPPAAYASTAFIGVCLTVISSGWIAPTLIRHEATRQHDAYARWAAHAPSSSVQGWYVPPPDFGPFPAAKSWPELIVSATTPPRHQLPTAPWYIVPGEENRPAYDREEIIERLLLVLLAVGSTVAGATIGRFIARSTDAIDCTNDAAID
jgi:hypothetical protein